MNCYRAQQLVSPYLDQQLTGAEMLEMQRHLAGCRRCAREYQEARQTKLLLRSLSLSQPPRALDMRILSRIAQEGRGPLPAQMVPNWSLPGVGPAPRGRRFATALGLSCLVVFSVAAPFAPSSADIAVQGRAASASLGQNLAWGQFPSAATLPAPAAMNASLLRIAPMASDSAAVTLTTSDPSQSRQDESLARQYVQTPLSEPGAEPFGEDAVSGYVSGGVVLAGFQH